MIINKAMIILWWSSLKLILDNQQKYMAYYYLSIEDVRTTIQLASVWHSPHDGKQITHTCRKLPGCIFWNEAPDKSNKLINPKAKRPGWQRLNFCRHVTSSGQVQQAVTRRWRGRQFTDLHKNERGRVLRKRVKTIPTFV